MPRAAFHRCAIRCRLVLRGSPPAAARARSARMTASPAKIDAPAPKKPGHIPTVGFVSLGCPKALVDSERIMTKLRAEGYRVAPDYAGRRRGGGQHLRLPGLAPSRRASTPSARPWPRTAASSSPAASASRKGASARPPGRAGGHRPASVRAGGRSRARRRAAAARSVRRPGAARGPAPDAAPLRLSEDLRGLQQPLLVLHHPAPARRSRQPARRTT